MEDAMIYRVAIADIETGETFTATRRFRTRAAAEAWAAAQVHRFAGRCEWRVEAEPDTCPAARGLDG
jgi:hypothetical protein